MRRSMVQAVVLLLMVCAASVTYGASESPRPNIVLIMADDMGFSDLGCYGSEIATPNLDRLAGQGLRFTQFYNTARCCPTRAALLTGLYSHQAGVGHMVRDAKRPGYRGFLNDRCVTIAEVMGAAGYRTWISGKWHVGEKRPHWPVDRGFERCYSLISGGSNYFRLDPERTMARNADSFVPADDDKYYLTDAFTEAALTFISEHRDKPEPFFLYLAYTAPHWPLHAWPEDIARYQGKYMEGWDALRKARHDRMIQMGLVDERWPLTPRDERVPAWDDVKPADRAAWDRKMAVYAAQIDRMDQGIGRVLAKLDEIGVSDNTLVLFLSDNGGCAEIIDRGKPGVPPGPKESFLSYGIGWANASNTPFRLYKHWVHEGGISTPLIVRWPSTIRKGGAMTREPGHVTDIMATCVEVAGAEYPTTRNGQPITPLEGRSLVPVFRGGTRSSDAFIFWEHEGNCAVRQGRWKLVARHGEPWELYDIEADRTEMHDLATEHPDRVEALRAAHEAWAKRANVEPWNKVRNASIRPRRPAEPASRPVAP
ncbi:MAG: arylsulfatase [Phycisphaerae bacterium]|nr:arylsulfatase [Phycisphaerae bacterium]